MLNIAVDAAIGACGGDARAAVRALIVANNYLEAEVKRLTEAASSGFTRGLKAKRKAQPVFPQLNGDRTKWRQDFHSRFPHSVDLVPPEDGFPDAVEQQIVQFLMPLFGKYELYAVCRAMSHLSAIALPIDIVHVRSCSSPHRLFRDQDQAPL
jgi:hypothetical protein